MDTVRYKSECPQYIEYMEHLGIYSYRWGGRPTYIEKPNKVEVTNAITNPPIQVATGLWSGMRGIPVNMIERLPISKVADLQKPLLNTPATSKKHIRRTPIAEAIATHFPRHRQMTAPTTQQVHDRNRVCARPGNGRDTWARMLDARKRENDTVPIAP